MNERIKPVVIAIASVSGGGKTTLVNHLATHINRSKALFFDDYDLDGPDDVMEWIERGANIHEWNLDPFIEDLKKLQKDPLNYIFLDYPFAYQHAHMKKFIDLAVFIETPLDISLARRISRDFHNSSVEDIMKRVNHYATRGRYAYLHMLETIRVDSDLLVDGTMPVEVLGGQLMKKVRWMP
ncbi:nucleoside/nucleotide kinase family protein [Planococcus maritimus]|uniref:hypothetical protein n=1 Tax=Planococcus maritimus TaxID=192421 RepID=UPI000791B940|nr:hypothetical protein [Planococcus maritimus]KYG59958.1 hypothetical protein AY633_06910 [Planococcus maritimus]OED33649.1 hypothetical protein BHE17_14770 [Planococcus maritimus]